MFGKFLPEIYGKDKARKFISGIIRNVFGLELKSGPGSPLLYY